MNYTEAFDSYIKGQVAKAWGYQSPTTSNNYKGGYYVVFENGYSVMTYGGGCSGSDCISSYILAPDDTILAQDNESE